MLRTRWAYGSGAAFDHKWAALSEGICPKCSERLRPLARPVTDDLYRLAWCDNDGCWMWGGDVIESTAPEEVGAWPEP